MTIIPDTTPLVRAAEPVDGRLFCWRCESACDTDGYCSLCGAVTAPALEPAVEPSRSPAPATPSDPHTFDALVGLAVPGCEVCELA